MLLPRIFYILQINDSGNFCTDQIEYTTTATAAATTTTNNNKILNHII